MAGVYKLLGACCHVLSNFDPASSAVEEHLQEQLISSSCSVSDKQCNHFHTTL